MASILKELPELVINGIISSQTAKDIEDYYNSKKQPEGNVLLTVFGTLGGILVGLGIILIFAHNWDNFSQTVKVILALFPLLAFQALTAYTIVKEKSSIWKDSAGTLLFFAIGGAIALIAQIYNIPGDVGSFLLTWIVLGLSLVYILRSNTLAFLTIVFSAFYVTQAGYFNPERPWLYLVIIGALLPFYLKQIKEIPNSNVVSVFNWLLPLSGYIAIGGFIKDGREWEVSILIYVAYSCILYNIGMLPYFINKQMRRNGYLCLGITGMVILLLITSFKWLWSEFDYDNHPLNILIAWGILIVIGLFIGLKSKKAGHPINPFQAVTIIFPVVYFIGMLNSFIPVILINLLVLALGIGCIKQGVNKFDFKVLNFGMIIVSALIICRFFDTSGSFVIKGLLFVAVGVGFFLTNYILIKKKKNNLANASHNEN